MVIMPPTDNQPPRTSPDLVVGTPTVSDSSPAPGASFTLSATASNDGNGESAATTLRYFRSTDVTITTSDTEVGTDAVAGLAASVSDSQSVELAAPSAPGPYYYGACVDAVAGESDTANKCSTSVQVTVREPDHPELTVVSPSVSNSSPAVGSQFTLSATVQNDGNGESAATTLRYYRSTDATITTSDTEVGTDAVAGLAPSGSDRQSVELAAPSAPGPYYYGACVDAVAGESDTANKCSTSVQVTVREPDHPDLTVVSPSVSDDSPAPGASFTLSATVQNDGNGESAGTTLRYYRSTDATITTSDTEVGTDAVAGLAASVSDSQSVELVAPSAPGTYHYGACVDAVAGESDAANNCSTAVQVTVPAPERPDLMVVSPSVSNNSPTVGSQFTLSATVQNDGNGESAATTLRYFLSTDATITTSDAEVGTDAVAGEGCGQQLLDIRGRPCAVRERQAVGGTGRALGARAILLRRVRGRSGGRVRYGQQLLHIRAGNGAGAGPSGSDGGVAFGERRQPGPRGEFHPVGDGAERRQRRIGGDDAALLPVDGRDHHDIGHGSGDGRGGRACAVRKRQSVGGTGRALGARDVPLRGVCGRGGGRVMRPTTARQCRDGTMVVWRGIPVVGFGGRAALQPVGGERGCVATVSAARDVPLRGVCGRGGGGVGCGQQLLDIRR